MASTSRDGTIRPELGKPQDPPIVLHDEGLDDWVWSATFTPDDEQLMMGVHSALGKSSKVGEEAKSNETIHVWPTKIEAMSSQLCTYIKRNMTKDEWDTYASGLKYERTCETIRLITNDFYEATLFPGNYLGVFGSGTCATKQLHADPSPGALNV